MTPEILALRRQLAEMSAGLNRIAGEQKTVTFGEFAARYLSEKLDKPSLRDATKRSFENQVRLHLGPAFGALSIDQLKNSDWLAWVKQTTRLTRFFNARKALTEIMRAALNEGHIQKLPKFDDPDEPRSVGRVVAQSEVLAVIWRSTRHFRVIFYTFWKMGCRPREILQWAWSMIRWQEPGQPAWIDIPARISKTGRARSIPINATVTQILRRRFNRGNGSQFVFPSRINPDTWQKSYQSAFLTASRKASVLKFVPYDMRRTLITVRAASGTPLVYLGKLLDTSAKMIEGTYAKSQRDVLEAIVI